MGLVASVQVGDVPDLIRADRFLGAEAEGAGDDEPLYGLTRSASKRLFADGRITVNGRVAKPSTRLHPGDELLVAIPEPEPSELVPEPMALDILYEDSHLIVINKPAGLVVHPGAGHSTGTLVHGLLHHCRDLAGIGGQKRPGIVHRLDRDTTGAMVVAKHDRAHAALVDAFKAREVSKTYEAVTVGLPSPADGRIEAPIQRHRTDRKRFTSRAGVGKAATTLYRTLGTCSGLAHLELDLLTGRTHQIRVHLTDAGCPLLADSLYGRRRPPAQLGRMAVARNQSRQALHARRLAFTHPHDGRTHTFDAPYPPDFAALVAAFPRLAVEPTED